MTYYRTTNQGAASTPILADDEAASRMLRLAEAQSALIGLVDHRVRATNHRLALRCKDGLHVRAA